LTPGSIIGPGDFFEKILTKAEKSIIVKMIVEQLFNRKAGMT